MTKRARYAFVAPAIAALVALSACGRSDGAKEETQADNVEMPAEEGVSDIDATPVADSAAEPGTVATAAPTAPR
ncbi:MAG: hypothetical protein RLZZ427_888 [Pseudomonadota bacterium]|jgi:hypothetical protein